ncbi:hypothetical protein FHL15_001850 [Xylaria flabelliformis]|uniref:Uncharacterized protein n=1 Tax=Xylaria flabelliformis TaxID=2512241 RepID=A0A553IA28_9PEZI|nr:hypothetical protein FHL15_001850 [Xylaria flabelliformis]
MSPNMSVQAHKLVRVTQMAGRSIKVPDESTVLILSFSFVSISEPPSPVRGTNIGITGRARIVNPTSNPAITGSELWGVVALLGNWQGDQDRIRSASPLLASLTKSRSDFIRLIGTADLMYTQPGQVLGNLDSAE